MCNVAVRPPGVYRGMRSTFLRAAALAWAALSLLLAVHWFAELGMVGFPDGYVTPFARATGPLLHLLASACLIQGLYFLCRALLGKGFGGARSWPANSDCGHTDGGADVDCLELPPFPDLQQCL